MNKWLRIFLVAILTPIGVSAELLVPTLNGIRSLLSKRTRVTPVIFRTETGPGYGKDQPGGRIGPGLFVFNPPPNLTPEHIEKLGARLGALVEKEEAANGGQSTVTRRQIQALTGRMEQIDRSFVDPIPPEEWDKIIAKMGEEAENTFNPAQGNWDETMVKMLKTAVGALKNIHSDFMSREELEAFSKSDNDYVGGGFEISKLKDEEGGFAKAGLVFPGSPAERAGLKEDDVIELIGGPDAGWVGTADKDLSEIVKRILGKDGSEIQLIVRRNGGPLQTIKITRGRIERKAVYSRMQTGDIGYVFFSNFTRENIDHTVMRHITQLLTKGAKKLILDVRGNPGGSVETVAWVASEFLKKDDEIVAFKKQGEVVAKKVTDADGLFAHIPVVVLINGGSASASEILAAALQDHMQAPTVIGSRSFGKGTAQTVSPGPFGALRLTGTRWYSPNGRTIDAEHDENGYPKKGTGGVIPDITVETTPEQEKAIRNAIVREMHGAPVTNRPADPALEKAVEVLGRRSAS